MPKTSHFEAYMAARVQVVQSIARASGWELHTSNAELMVESSVFFYVFDTQCNWCWSCSLPKSMFFEASLQTNDFTVEQAASSLQAKISDCVGRPAGPDQQWENELAIHLVAYVTKTETYRQTQRATRAPHFGVLHYSKTRMIRPFALKGSDRFLLPAATVLEYAKDVISVDSQRHPEWVS